MTRLKSYAVRRGVEYHLSDWTDATHIELSRRVVRTESGIVPIRISIDRGVMSPAPNGLFTIAGAIVFSHDTIINTYTE